MAARRKKRKPGTVQAAPESAYTLEAADLPHALKNLVFPGPRDAYRERLGRKKYERRLRKLQIELVKLHGWLRANDERVMMVFEGRDTAGKGGSIKRITQYLNPRHVRVVALPKPSDVEQGQWYFQRYVAHMPTEGEMVLFDRSWYNRAGVERVMGFCDEGDVERFFLEAPVLEGMLARERVHLFKFWLTVGRAEQLKRFYARKTSPLKHWKLSPMDYEAVGKWDEYTAAIADIFRNTDSVHAPWTVVDSNDQRRARLECIKVILDAFDYEGKDPSNIEPIDGKLVMTGAEYLDSRGL